MPTRAPTALAARDRRGFWIVAFAFAAALAVAAVPTPLYAIYAARDGLTPLLITVIFSAYAAGVVVSLFLVGHLSDVHGRRRILFPALLVGLLSTLVFVVARDLPALLVGRVLSGLSVGAVTATATAWLAELHGRGNPGASPRRAQVVATVANIGGIGVGPLASGAMAQWVGAPLRTPYLVFLGLLVVATGLLALAPETRPAARPLPRWRPQRIAVPAEARVRFAGAASAAVIVFATFGLFTSLVPSFLSGILGHPSHALAGATTFAVFAAAAGAQALLTAPSLRGLVLGGMATIVTGLALVVVAVWLPSPSLALFVLGGAVAGLGAGALFKGAVTTVIAIAPEQQRAEALAGLFLAGYAGLSGPVVGLGLLDQVLAARVGLLVFAGALVLGAVVAAPFMLGGSPRAGRGRRLGRGGRVLEDAA